MVTDLQGRPLHVQLTPGQQHEAPVAELLLDYLPGRVCLADTAYDSNAILEGLKTRDIKPVIPNRPERRNKRRLDKDLYSQRYLIECCFHSLKRCRRIATRFDKTLSSYAAFVHIAAALIWLT